MEIPTILILLCCSYCTLASHDGYTIPVENYETELQDLGETVDIPETPVRVVKITKTVAVKVPVPYPVKVIEKVPYPVHINKPYPVPVPQIVKVPHNGKHAHEHEGSNEHQQHDDDGNSYQVKEIYSPNAPSHESYGPEIQSFNGDNSGHPHSFGGYQDSSEGSYVAPSHSYHGNSAAGQDADSFESRSYDQAIRDYLHKHNSGGSNAGQNYKHF